MMRDATHLGGSRLLLSRLGLLLGELHGPGGTLRLKEVALLDTGLESLVEERIELGLRCGGDRVVGLDVFLDLLTAIQCQLKLNRIDSEGHCLPATVALLELIGKTC